MVLFIFCFGGRRAAPAYLLRVMPGRADTSPSENWWRHGVIYQVYPRSFKDGCQPQCTGTGSLRGVLEKLEYLAKDVGVTVIWLSPIYDSPMKDFGYDISNYTKIWPTFGTMADFDALMAKAKSLGVRILMDFVPNHSSDQHPWFLESKSSLDSEKRDWYMWRNGTVDEEGNLAPPTNWRSMFCNNAACSAWEYDNTTGQYYYHQFLSEQPDLNWRNPKVVEAMHDMMRFWLAKGVDGFRVDAFAYMLEDSSFGDEPLNPDWKPEPDAVAAGYSKVLHTKTENIDGLHGLLQGMQKVLKEFGDDRMMVGEVYQDNIISEEDVLSYYGTKEQPEFNMPFNMLLIGNLGAADVKMDIPKLRKDIDHYDKSLKPWAQPNWVIGNHDVHRVRSRNGGNEFISRSMHVLLLTLRGTPTIYNGDEFGMLDGKVPASKAQDPTCIKSAKAWNCRDPERTPLQWNTDNENAGFTDAGVVPWLPVSSDYVNTNADSQIGAPKSMLSMVKTLLRLRQGSDALRAGEYTSIDDKHAGNNVFVYQRSGKDGRYVIAHNFGPHDEKFVSSSLGGLSGILRLDSRGPISGDPLQNVKPLSTIQLQAHQSMVYQIPPEVEPFNWLIALWVFLAVAAVSIAAYVGWRRRSEKEDRKTFNQGLDNREASVVEFSVLQESNHYNPPML